MITDLLGKEEQEKIEKQTIEEMKLIGRYHKELLARINVINYGLCTVEHQLMVQKEQYEYEFNKLCLSDEYNRKFKTIKAKEQQATIELNHNKQRINKLESTRRVYKAELEGLRNELRYTEMMGED